MKTESLVILALIGIAVFLISSVIPIESLLQLIEVRLGLTLIVFALGSSLIVFSESDNPTEVHCPHCRTTLYVSITEKEEN